MTTNTRTAGTDVRLNDVMLDFMSGGLLSRDFDSGRVVTATPGRHQLGARFVDVVLNNGEAHRCWGGFFYSIARVDNS